MARSYKLLKDESFDAVPFKRPLTQKTFSIRIATMCRWQLKATAFAEKMNWLVIFLSCCIRTCSPFHAVSFLQFRVWDNPADVNLEASWQRLIFLKSKIMHCFMQNSIQMLLENPCDLQRH